MVTLHTHIEILFVFRNICFEYVFDVLYNNASCFKTCMYVCTMDYIKCCFSDVQQRYMINIVYHYIEYVVTSLAFTHNYALQGC